MLPVIPVTVNAADETLSLSFADKAQRTSFSTSSQVWEQNGVKFTNNKASSTSSVADYAKPVRLYASSSIVVEVPGKQITKIVFDANSSSYATALKNSIGTPSDTTVTASSDKVTVEFLSAVNSFTIAKLTAQVRLDAITVTCVEAASGGGSSEPDTTACEHANKIENNDGIAASCTTEGKTASVKCTDCGETVTPTQPIAALGHNYVDGVCSRCGETAVIYQLVTNISDLKIGDSIIIVATGYDVALSTTQNKNNRAETAITKLSNQAVLVDSVQVLTLEAGTADNTFAFNTGSGYLYAAGGSSDNYLKTKNDLDNTGSWSIEIAEDGTATVKAQIEGRNWLRYNSNNKLFSCYESGQQDVAIYKYQCPHTNATENEEQPATCTENGHSAYKHCNDCGEDIGKTVYPAGHVDENGDNVCDDCQCILCVAHEWEEEYYSIKTPATCTEPGVGIQKCKNCPTTQEVEIAALNHDLVDVDATPATCTEAGTAAGKKCQRCDYYEGRETIPATGHTYVDLECTKCGDTITDHSGVYYIATIRSSGNFWYMTSDLGDDSTKRYTAVDSGLTELPTMITETKDTYVFVLEINENGTYCIRALGVTGDNYLGWTSGNSGILVAKDEALKLTLTENEDGTISLHSGTRYLALNNTTGNDYFAFYEGTQKKKLSLIPAAAAPEYKGFSVSLDGGVTINLEYNVSAAWLELNPNAYVEFASEFGTTRIPVTAGLNTYSVSLTPKAIDSVVSFTLSDGENVVESFENVGYSVYAAYIRDNANTNEEYKAAIDLLDKIDQYGAAAKLDPKDDTIEVTTESFTDVEDWSTSKKKSDEAGIFSGEFSADLDQKITVNIGVNTSIDYTGYTIAVSIGGNSIASGDFAKYITKSGNIVIKGFDPTQLNDEISIVITNGEVTTTCSFNINSYFKYIYNAVKVDKDTQKPVLDENNNPIKAFSNFERNMAAVAYQYGVAAENYNK